MQTSDVSSRLARMMENDQGMAEECRGGGECKHRWMDGFWSCSVMFFWERTYLQLMLQVHHQLFQYFVADFRLAMCLKICLSLLCFTPATLIPSQAKAGSSAATQRSRGPRRRFGRPPDAVSWMVAPSLHWPNEHTWLHGSCATAQQRLGTKRERRFPPPPLFFRSILFLGLK